MFCEKTVLKNFAVLIYVGVSFFNKVSGLFETYYKRRPNTGVFLQFLQYFFHRFFEEHVQANAFTYRNWTREYIGNPVYVSTPCKKAEKKLKKSWWNKITYSLTFSTACFNNSFLRISTNYLYTYTPSDKKILFVTVALVYKYINIYK